MNLGLHWLRERDGEEGTLVHWDGMCSELADCVSQWLDSKGVSHRTLWLSPEGDDGLKRHAYFTSVHGQEWLYHVVIEVDGVVHDPWFETPCPLDEYLARMFPAQAVVVEPIDYSPLLATG